MQTFERYIDVCEYFVRVRGAVTERVDSQVRFSGFELCSQNEIKLEGEIQKVGNCGMSVASEGIGLTGVEAECWGVSKMAVSGCDVGSRLW